MSGRLRLHEALTEIMEGVGEVYYQPPPSVHLNYPCIVYTKTRIQKLAADNRSYRLYSMFEVTVMDRDPDSTLPDRVMELPYSEYDRHYTSGQLHHDIINIYCV